MFVPPVVHAGLAALPLRGARRSRAPISQTSAAALAICPRSATPDRCYLLLLYGHAHAARRARQDVHGCLDVVRIEIRELDFGDLPELLAGDAAHLVTVRHSGALGH